jgi:hypothetical protein
MTTATIEMFNALSQDMALQRSYAKSKTAVMRAFGLSRSEIATLKSGDVSKVKKLLTGGEPVCFLIGLARSSSSE